MPRERASDRPAGDRKGRAVSSTRRGLVAGPVSGRGEKTGRSLSPFAFVQVSTEHRDYLLLCPAERDLSDAVSDPRLCAEASAAEDLEALDRGVAVADADGRQ